MRHKQIAVLLSFILLLGGCAAATAQMRPQLHQRPAGFWENEKTAVQILHIFSKMGADADGKPVVQLQMIIGTGSVVDKNGLVLTNNHIVATYSPEVLPDQPETQSLPVEEFMICTVKDGDRDCNPAAVLATDEEHDLALMQVDRVFSKAVEFVDDSGLKSGDDIYFWGNVFQFLPPVGALWPLHRPYRTALLQRQELSYQFAAVANGHQCQSRFQRFRGFQRTRASHWRSQRLHPRFDGWPVTRHCYSFQYSEGIPKSQLAQAGKKVIALLFRSKVVPTERLLFSSKMM